VAANRGNPDIGPARVTLLIEKDLKRGFEALQRLLAAEILLFRHRSLFAA